MDELTKVFESINNILNSVKLDDITAESNNLSQELPDGYYLSEVEKAEITISKTSKNPQVALQLKIVENGVSIDVDDTGKIIKNYVEKTQNRKIFLYYPIKDEISVKRFASDMLKFEGDTSGEPLLPREAFTSAEFLEESLDLLIGMRIFIQVSTSKNREGKETTWKNPISWKRASALELV